MTTLPASGYLSDSARTKGEQKTALENVLSGLKEIVGGAGETSYTLATNVYTPGNNGAVHVLDTQAAAPTDTLKNINTTNIRDGQEIWICIASNARIITVHDSNGGAGQIKLQDSTDVTMNDIRQWLKLKYKQSVTTFFEVGRSQNIDMVPCVNGAINTTANTVLAVTANNGKPAYRALVKADLNTIHNTDLGWQALANIAVVANNITPIQASQSIDTSAGAQQINGVLNTNFSDGRYLLLTPSSANFALTLKHNNGGGNPSMLLKGAADCILASTDQSVMFQRQGANWKEVARFGFSSSGLNQGICQGRLTLTTGVPKPTADQLNAGTLYFTPMAGASVSTFNGSSWTLNTGFTEKSITLATCIKNVTYDTFLVDTTLVIELLAWASTIATSSPTAGSNKTISVPSTAGVAVGDWVTVVDGTNNEKARVNAFSTNVSITVDSLANGYTTPTVYKQSRATALVTQDGSLVKSGSTTRLFLGSFTATAGNGTTGGQTESSLARRKLWNMYNRDELPMVAQDPNASIAGNATNAFLPTNGNKTAGQGRVEFTCGLVENFIVADTTVSMGANSLAEIGLGLNSISVNSAKSLAMMSAGSYVDFKYTKLTGAPTLGDNFVQSMDCQYAGGGAFTIYSTQTVPSPNAMPYGGGSSLHAMFKG